MARAFQIHRSFRLRKNSLPVKLMIGRGGSVLLQKGGTGGASSYDSDGEYHSITGMGLGMGLGGGALSSLQPRMGRKPKNIRF
jgi:hypothetical protein